MTAEAQARPAGPGRVGGLPVRVALAYLGLVVVPVLLAVLAVRFGQQVDPGAPAAVPVAPAPRAAPPDPYPRLILALPVILGACYLAGSLAARLSQPRVIGEMITGVLLGPSVLGALWPAGYRWLFPAYLIPSITLLAQLGLIFFMFAVGHEMNLLLLRSRRATAAMVSHVSIALPFLSGIALALAMYRPLGGSVPFPAFALFLAVSMSVTAFPVLARILADRGLAGTPLGSVALTCAAIDDVTAWCLLGLVSAIARQRGTGGVAVTVAASAVFVGFMLYAVRPALARLLAPAGGRPRTDSEGARRSAPARLRAQRARRRANEHRALPEPAVLPVLLGGVMLSALATNTIGIHPIFGAFLFGAITPRGAEPVQRGSDQVRAVTGTLLLPLFFVHIGLSTKFGLLGADGRLWAWCALVTAVAIAGKAAGSALAARLTRTGWREALSLGVLMNCRGLTELVVLSVGLQLGVIGPTVFAMLVLMTLVSTMITAPGLSLVARLTERPA